jgi:hypothetical protein
MEKTTVKERMELTKKLANELSPLLNDGWVLECVHSYVKNKFELKVRDKSSCIDDFYYTYGENFTEGLPKAKEYFTDRLKYLAKEYSDKPKKKSKTEYPIPPSRPYTGESLGSATWMATDPALPSSSPTPFTLPPNLGVASIRNSSPVGMDLVNPAAFQYYGLGATGRGYSIEQSLASSSPFVESLEAQRTRVNEASRNSVDPLTGNSLVSQIRNHARDPLPTILDNENVVGDIEYTANGHTNTLTPDIMLQTMRDINNSSEGDIF